MKHTRHVMSLAAALGLLTASALLFATPAQGARISHWDSTEPTDLSLSVTPIEQSRTTSCGEAAIAMAYDYANPESQVSEENIVEYAETAGLYTPQRAPFTSPDDMVTIAQHFAGPAYTGNVASQEDGLWLLQQQLEAGSPVIIDVTTLLYDLNSGAHFIVVTAVSVEPQTGDTAIGYNNPLTGQNESADWDGNEGIWNAWQNNDDPGGSGWWLVVPEGTPPPSW